MENNNIILKFTRFFEVNILSNPQKYIELVDPKNPEKTFSMKIITFEKILTGQINDVTYYKIDNNLHLVFTMNKFNEPIFTEN